MVRVGILWHHQLIDDRLSLRILQVTVEPNPTLSFGILSGFIGEISLTRFCNMLMRDSTRRCRSFAA